MAFLNAFENTLIGNTAVTTSQFILKPSIDTSSAYVTYTLLDEDGTVYSTGNGGTIDYIAKPNAKVIQSAISLPIPSTIPVNVLGTTYQVRLELHLLNNEIIELYSNLTVLPLEITFQGTNDIIELKGNEIKASIVIDGTPSIINPVLYWKNELALIPALTVATAIPTSDGNLYSTTIDTTDQDIIASLSPFNLVWQYIVSGNKLTEISSVWVVTPSILLAAKDLMSEINKSRSSLRDKPTFSVVDALTHLRLGGDAFNGFANVTNFTFTNATGPVRNYWLGFSKISALRSQQIFEGESAFDFQGQAISITVDRMALYETMANTLESSLNDSTKEFKKLLSKRGNISGDGDIDPTRLRAGALGNVGLSLSPVSRFGAHSKMLYLGLQRSIF